jgi:anion-transporting  ArsA/GET3 family ATPase
MEKLKLSDVKLVSLPDDEDEVGPPLTQKDLDEALELEEFIDQVVEKIAEKTNKYRGK